MIQIGPGTLIGEMLISEDFCPENRFYLKLQTDGRQQKASDSVVIDALQLCSHRPEEENSCIVVPVTGNVNPPNWESSEAQIPGDAPVFCWLYFDIHLLAVHHRTRWMLQFGQTSR